MATEIRVKRIYEKPTSDDGYRIFVDRLWSRGVTKAAAKIDLWAKELTPSHELRKWFHEAPNRQAEFEQRYRAELTERHSEITALLELLNDQRVLTLVTATKDLQHGHASVLMSYLTSTISTRSTG